MTAPSIAVWTREPALVPKAEALASRLKLPYSEACDYRLLLETAGLSLEDLSAPEIGGIRVDFLSGARLHRQQEARIHSEMIARAAGLASGIRPSILDATAGLLGDTLILAHLGCAVVAVERSPIIAALIIDGLERAATEESLVNTLARIHFVHGDAKTMMRESASAPEVIYLDPMFPERTKSALVKKEMRLFRAVVGEDLDAEHLLADALACASHRVVVKRPRKAAPLPGKTPSFSLEGKSSRFDIYAKARLTKKKPATP